MKKGISLVGIKDIKTVKEIINRYPQCCFELSYLSSNELLKEQLPVIKNKIASAHLLCPMQEFFPNLACNDVSWSVQKIKESAFYSKSLGADVVVLHPGYLVDGLLSTVYEKRLYTMKHSDLEQYMLLKEESVCKPDYIKSERYRKAFKKMAENAITLSNELSKVGMYLALENLNPRAGYMVLCPDEIIELAGLGLYINLDVGHLQVSSALFGFDLYKEMQRIFDTGRVKSIHLHSNESCSGVYKDSHRSADKYINASVVIDMAREADSNIILETLEEPIHNVSLLFD